MSPISDPSGRHPSVGVRNPDGIDAKHISFDMIHQPMAKQIFISHSSKDAESAERMVNYLENAGLSCFIAPRDIEGG